MEKKNHKWKPVEYRYYAQKEDRCVRCGIHRYWCGGDMQGWNYVDYSTNLGTIRDTWVRPNCEPERDRSRWFNSSGHYID